MELTNFYYLALVALSAIITVFIYCVARGPGVFDRLIGLMGISTKAILFLALIGAYFGSLEMFIDLALGYGLLNLVGALATGKYLEKKGSSL